MEVTSIQTKFLLIIVNNVNMYVGCYFYSKFSVFQISSSVIDESKTEIIPEAKGRFTLVNVL